MQFQLINSRDHPLLLPPLRHELQRLQVRAHLETSSYDSLSQSHQVEDLLCDFHALLDQQAFAAHRVFVALSPSLQVVGCVGWIREEEEEGETEGERQTETKTEGDTCGDSVNRSLSNGSNSNSGSNGDSCDNRYGETVSVRKRSGTTASISFLSVDKQFRRFGIGAALLDAALNDCVAEKIQRVRLLTLRGVMAPACALYESRGFRIYKQRNGASAALDFYHVLFYEKLLVEIDSDMHSVANAIESDMDIYPSNSWDTCLCVPCQKFRDRKSDWPGREEAIERALASLS